MRKPRVVSIPFKRESVFRVVWHYHHQVTRLKVSIPFKRESVFRVRTSRMTQVTKLRVSIPFKRESVFRELDRKHRTRSV